MSQPLRLPFPPSANSLWRAVKGRNIKSRKYREWLEECSRWIVARRDRPSIGGQYRLTIIAHRPDRRRRDLGNLEKPISDALQSCGVIRDDCDAKAISLEWSDAEPGRFPYVEVSLSEIATVTLGAAA